MRLIRLSANKPSFQTVVFNPNGLSIIVGKKAGTTPQNRKKTYNGVGKSLVVALVHFCLGANERGGLIKALSDWVFTLDFEIGGDKFTAVRSMHEPKKIVLNDRVLKLETFRERLGELLFELPDGIAFLTYRALISRFVRPKSESYKSYDDPVPEEQEYSTQLCNAFLLGLDPYLAEAKHRLRRDLKDAENLAKNLKKDEVLKQFFLEGKNADFEIVRLDKKISEMQIKVDHFVIADDFDAIKKEADALSEELRALRNRRTLVDNAVRSIEKSLQIQPDMSSEDLLRFYENAKIQLTDLVVKEVREIEVFNQKLIADRQLRLENERRTFLKEREQLKDRITIIGKLEDEKLQRLASTGALDDYQALTNELQTLKMRRERLESFTKLLEEYKIKQLNLESQLNDENIETINYLARHKKTIVDKNILVFQELAQRFYQDKRAGIEITNNQGENQLRYNIKAEIEHDASDGINQVKLFCFDFTILKNRFNHRVDCLFHDSRLLDPMDSRQRATVFSTAYEETLNSGLQYIISVNEDTLQSVREHFDENSFYEIIEKNIVLELTDESHASKLLGISVDMNYEKD